MLKTFRKEKLNLPKNSFTRLATAIVSYRAWIMVLEIRKHLSELCEAKWISQKPNHTTGRNSLDMC